MVMTHSVVAAHAHLIHENPFGVAFGAAFFFPKPCGKKMTKQQKEKSNMCCYTRQLWNTCLQKCKERMRIQQPSYAPQASGKGDRHLVQLPTGTKDRRSSLQAVTFVQHAVTDLSLHP